MKLLLPVLVVLVCVAGCSKYRPNEMPDPKEVLPSNVWEFENHFNINVDPNNLDCSLPHYLVFNKDRSGFYTYEHPCDSSGPDTLRFTWSISTDQLYVRMILNKAEFVETKFIICDYDMVRMDCRTMRYSYLKKPFHVIDGNYKPKSN